MVWPLLAPFVVQFPYHSAQHLVYSFHSAIGLRMIRHRSYLLDVQVVTHFLQDVVTEFSTLIRHQSSGESIVAKVFIIEAFGNRDGSFIWHFVGLYVT